MKLGNMFKKTNQKNYITLTKQEGQCSKLRGVITGGA